MPDTITLYVATTNAGKLRDFEQIADESGGRVRFLPLPRLTDIPPPSEDAATFEENAQRKAIAYSLHQAGEIVMADDSGLEVDALDGAPGVRSARYAADAKFHPDPEWFSIDERNNLLLLENLREFSASQRTAHYRCVIAAARGGECIATTHGVVEGQILDTPRGSGGFGYDPLFYLPELDQTMAEISLAKKNQISHRGKALRALIEKLR